MNAILAEAFKRAGLQSVVLCLGTFFTLLPQTDNWKILVSACGIAFLGPLGFRGAVEGAYDKNRADNGQVIPADVPVESDKLKVTVVP